MTSAIGSPEIEAAQIRIDVEHSRFARGVRTIQDLVDQLRHDEREARAERRRDLALMNKELDAARTEWDMIKAEST